MSLVTVLGAAGTTVSLPFTSHTNAVFAQQLASQISAAITSGSLSGGPINPPSAPSGAAGTENILVVGGVNSIGGAPAATSYVLDDTYAAVVNNSSAPVTVTAGSLPTAPVSVLGGVGGTTFFGGASSVGGSIALGGGANTIAGSASFHGSVSSTNGGLNGDWSISTGAGIGAGSDAIYLATGADTVSFGANDSVNAGGASVLGFVTNTDRADPTFFIGSANSTVFGQASSNVYILGNDTSATGGGYYQLGTGGNGVIAASAGSSTLVGGGYGDVLFASSASGAQAVMKAGLGDETLQGGYSGGSSTLYGGIGNDELVIGQLNKSAKDAVYIGSGTDTVWAGVGQDSIFFNAATARSVHDTIYNYAGNTNVVLEGYGGYSVTSAAGTTLTLTLSDSSTIIFSGLSTEQSGLLKITSTSAPV